MMDAFAPFPTLHPLVVHAPVVLLPLAALLFIVAWGYRNRALEWTATVLLASGWIGALLASQVFHPHTDTMTLLAREALGLHEFWADWTQGLAAASLLAMLIYRVRWFGHLRSFLRILALVLCLGAAVAVTFAGHYGATLTHVHKVEVEKE